MFWHATEEDHAADFDSLSDEVKVAVFMDLLDSSRIDNYGGYPSQYVIDRQRVIHADYDGGKEHNAVTLEITPIARWLKSHEWLRELIERDNERDNEYRKVAT